MKTNLDVDEKRIADDQKDHQGLDRILDNLGTSPKHSRFKRLDMKIFPPKVAMKKLLKKNQFLWMQKRKLIKD